MNLITSNEYFTIKNVFKKPLFINLLLFIISFLLIFIIIYNFLQPKKEGFSLNDVNKVFNQIDDVVDLAEQLPKKLDSIDNKLTGKVTELGDQIKDKLEKMGQQIEKNTTDLVTNKLTSIFTQLGDMFNEALIQPILNLFTGIGNIFVQIFGILQEIGNKIVQLPNCILTYAIKSTIDTINYLYNKIVPKIIRDPLSFIYKYTLGIIFDFISRITGFDASVNKCYGFNINSEINKINSNLNDINDSFKNDFGNINFSQIKI